MYAAAPWGRPTGRRPEGHRHDQLSPWSDTRPRIGGSFTRRLRLSPTRKSEQASLSSEHSARRPRPRVRRVVVNPLPHHFVQESFAGQPSEPLPDTGDVVPGYLQRPHRGLLVTVPRSVYHIPQAERKREDMGWGRGGRGERLAASRSPSQARRGLVGHPHRWTATRAPARELVGATLDAKTIHRARDYREARGHGTRAERFRRERSGCIPTPDTHERRQRGADDASARMGYRRATDTLRHSPVVQAPDGHHGRALRARHAGTTHSTWGSRECSWSTPGGGRIGSTRQARSRRSAAQRRCEDGAEHYFPWRPEEERQVRAASHGRICVRSLLDVCFGDCRDRVCLC